MNKAEFVKKIVENSTEEINQKQVNAVLVALESVIQDAVLSGDEVTIPGICKIKSKVVPERTGTILVGENKGKPWTKPEHQEATVKIVPSLKNIFE